MNKLYTLAAVLLLPITMLAQNNRLWGTYFGGPNQENGQRIATDSKGNVYISGSTMSTTGIASAGAYQTTFGGALDAFLAKFDKNGNLKWATYYGGSNIDYGIGVAVDSKDNVYLVGGTSSTSGIATAGSFQPSLVGGGNHYLVKFDSNGNRKWATYYGGGNEASNLCGVTIDRKGNIYLAGSTASTSNVASGGYQNTYGGGTFDTYLVKFDSSGNRNWATYYGGAGVEWFYSVTADNTGNVYLVGSTDTNSASVIASVGAHQTVYGGGTSDGFIVKFSTTGARLWATFYGGTQPDPIEDVAVDPNNNVFITGLTYSTNAIATAGAFQTINGTGGDAFLVKFDSNGVRKWGTYYGGTGQDGGDALAIDNSGNIYMIGGTTSATSISSGGYQNAFGGNSDAMAVHFDENGNRISATYYGGPGIEGSNGAAVDKLGNLYLGGALTNSTTAIATAGAYQTVYGGGYDDFLVKFSTCSGAPAQPGVISGPALACTGSPTTYKVAAVAGATSYTWSLPGGWAGASTSDSIIATVGASGGTVSVTANNACGSSTAQTLTVTVNDITASITPVNELCHGDCNGQATTNITSGTGPFTYSWSNAATTSATTGLCATSFTVTVTGSGGCTATASVTITQPTTLSVGTTINNNVFCHGGSTGKITSNPSGGTGAYTYSWSNSATSAAATGLTAGSYTITVTDANGCTATAGATITEPTQLRDSISSQTNILCNGGNTGSLTVGVKGGTAAYTYLWTPAGQTTATITGLTVGCYTVTVTDNNGCTATATACITQPTLLKVSSITANPDSICLGGCSTISITGTGGTPAYSYSWSNGNTTSSQSVCPITTTTYTVIITDSHGCTHDSIIKVVVNPPPTVTLSAAKDTQCVNSTTDLLTGTPAGGTYSGPGVTANNFDANTAGAGLHKVYYTYTDNHGCTGKDSINIKVNLCTGVPEVNLLESEIKFYPNPFSQSINIDNSTNEAVSITIFNMMGQQMGTWQLDKGLNTISTETYPSGVYMVQVKTKDGVLNKKLVKVN